MSDSTNDSLRFAPIKLWRRGGTARRLVIAWLVVAAVAIPSGVATRLMEWTGLELEMAGLTIHVTVYLPMLFCVPLALWLGYAWAAIPAYCSTFLVALLGGMPVGWIAVFALANPLGLAVIVLVFEGTTLRTDLRSFASAFGFIMVMLLGSLAGSAGAFIWAHTNDVGLNEALPVWQGWWVGGWLQAVLIVGPAMWLLTPLVDRRLELVRGPRKAGQRDSRKMALAAFALMLVVVAYVWASRVFSLSQLADALSDPSSDSLPTALGNVVDGLTFPLVLLAVLVASMGYLSYVTSLRANGALAALNRQLSRTNRELALNSHQDALTGLPNRRALVEFLEGLEADGRDYAVLIADLDHFKAVNDTYGHSGGDAALVAAATRMQACLRTTDMAGRWGGEEFLIVLPEQPLNLAIRTAERLRIALSSEPVAADGVDIRITASIGAASRMANDADAHDLIARADAALYDAKRTGRDQVVGHGS